MATFRSVCIPLVAFGVARGQRATRRADRERDSLEKGMLARITNEVVDAKGRKKAKKKRRKLF